MASKTASKAVDFARIYSRLNLSKETIASLQAFRKRHSEAQRIHGGLKAQPATLDLAPYRAALKNQAVVDEAARVLAAFKPVTYDVQAHVKAVEAFEGRAVAKAESTAQRIDAELRELQETLENIERARPFEELTVEQVGEAHPHLEKTVETMMQKGKWTVPGYREKFGDLALT